MQYGVNKPLRRAQMKLLRLGFTATSVGVTGQEIKQANRASKFPTTNRRRTPGRILQTILLTTGKTKQIWHKTTHLV